MGGPAASVVHVEALVRGMGQEARCTLQTWKERSSTGRVFVRGRLVDDPPELPDGPYEVTVAGQQFTTRKWSGLWDLTYLPAGLRMDDAA